MSGNKSQSADGKFILVVEGAKLDVPPFNTRAEADAEAKKRQQLLEGQGSKGQVEVKQILFG
jgi:hypothetical protein